MQTLYCFGTNYTKNWTGLQGYSVSLCSCYSSVCMLTPIKAPLYYAQIESITPTVDRLTGNDSLSVLLDDGDMQLKYEMVMVRKGTKFKNT